MRRRKQRGNVLEYDRDIVGEVVAMRVKFETYDEAAKAFARLLMLLFALEVIDENTVDLIVNGSDELFTEYYG